MKKEKLKELTKAESEVMYILWQKEEAFVQDLVEAMEHPKPAYNTVSTIVRILEQKGMVSHKTQGRSHLYFPLIQKEKYTRSFMKNVMTTYFENSLPQMVSFFARQEDLSVREMEEIKALLEKEISEKKKNQTRKRK
jgi:predicted transcriptional regulator